MTHNWRYRTTSVTQSLICGIFCCSKFKLWIFLLLHLQFMKSRKSLAFGCVFPCAKRARLPLRAFGQNKFVFFFSWMLWCGRCADIMFCCKNIFVAIFFAISAPVEKKLQLSGVICWLSSGPIMTMDIVKNIWFIPCLRSRILCVQSWLRLLVMVYGATRAQPRLTF